MSSRRSTGFCDDRFLTDYLYLRQLERDADDIEPERRWAAIIARLSIVVLQLSIVLRSARGLPLRSLWNFVHRVTGGLVQISLGLVFRLLRRLFRAVLHNKVAMKFFRLKLLL